MGGAVKEESRVVPESKDERQERENGRRTAKQSCPPLMCLLRNKTVPVRGADCIVMVRNPKMTYKDLLPSPRGARIASVKLNKGRRLADHLPCTSHHSVSHGTAKSKTFFGDLYKLAAFSAECIGLGLG